MPLFVSYIALARGKCSVEGSFVLNAFLFSYSESRRRIKIVMAQEQVGEVQCLEVVGSGETLGIFLINLQALMTAR